VARARRKPAQATAEPRPGSAVLNKVKLAVAMGLIGLLAVFGVRSLAPRFVGLALLAMAVGVLSALTTAGPTYDATCPACGRRFAFTRALGMRTLRCRLCGRRLRLERRDGGLRLSAYAKKLGS